MLIQTKEERRNSEAKVAICNEVVRSIHIRGRGSREGNGERGWDKRLERGKKTNGDC